MSLRQAWRFRFLPWLRERRERCWRRLAFLLPRPLVYWAFIRLASRTDGNPAEQTCGDVLKAHGAWAGR